MGQWSQVNDDGEEGFVGMIVSAVTVDI